MLYELKDYEKIRSLIKKLHIKLDIDAIIEGNCPGRIWVEDTNNPKTAFIWDKSNKFFLVGYETNNNFNEALERLITEEISPEAEKRDLVVFKIIYSSENWEKKIKEIFGNKSFIKRDRVFFAFKQPKMSDWREIVPSGFKMEPISEKLLARTNLENIDGVIEEIDYTWGSRDDFFNKAFGFCLIHGDEVVGWCTAEYISKNKCGIGIETFQKYQRRGFATLTAAATVEHALSKNLIPHWDSWATNIGSIKVAEKVGFEKVEDYTIYFGSLDEAINFLIAGEQNYRLKKFKEAAEAYEKAFKMREIKHWTNYYNAACAWALTGDSDSAIRNLHKAIDRGCTILDKMKKDEDLIGLHNTQEWYEVLEKLERKLKDV
ncbi:MAG: GNAT family N-acetyltransferase [Promethearchaeota archaeon]